MNEHVTIEHDPVARPRHYMGRNLEAITVIEHWGLGFHLGNALKYILRAGRKSKLMQQDIEKAVWYLRRAQSLSLVQIGCGHRKVRQITADVVIGDFEVAGGVAGHLGAAIVALEKASRANIQIDARAHVFEAEASLLQWLDELKAVTS